MVAARRASAVERQLASIAAQDRPIVAGPWLGEVGFELLYWLPFLRWFVERFEISPDRLIAVSRGVSSRGGSGVGVAAPVARGATESGRIRGGCVFARAYLSCVPCAACVAQRSKITRIARARCAKRRNISFSASS